MILADGDRIPLTASGAWCARSRSGEEGISPVMRYSRNMVSRMGRPDPRIRVLRSRCVCKPLDLDAVVPLAAGYFAHGNAV